VVAVLQPTLFLAMLFPLEGVATLVADAARPLLAALQLVAGFASGLPGAALTVAPSASTALLTGVGVMALLVACWRRAWRGPLAVSILCVGLIVWSPRAPLARPGGVEIHLLDVGQGDAVAVRTPAGRWILVDAGRTWSGGDAGRSVIVPYLRRRGGPLELLVLSHPHADHIGGAASVIRALRPPEVRDAAFVEPSGIYLEMLRTAARAGIRWQRARPGEVLELDGVRFAFLAPDSAWMQTLGDPNEASVVVRVAYGEHSVLLTGDAEHAAESWLVERNAGGLASTVLKVGHHGSATSSTPQFLDAVSPRLALVSVGAGNHYGHPSSEVMRRLSEAGATILRTDQLGTVVLHTNGAQMEVEAAGYRWTLARPLPQSAPDGHLSPQAP
jgi:competence protein ComEC